MNTCVHCRCEVEWGPNPLGGRSGWRTVVPIEGIKRFTCHGIDGRFPHQLDTPGPTSPLGLLDWLDA